jgi:hypothetical protein
MVQSAQPVEGLVEQPLVDRPVVDLFTAPVHDLQSITQAALSEAEFGAHLDQRFCLFRRYDPGRELGIVPGPGV